MANRVYNNREYSYGYYPKLEYWTTKLMEAIKMNNIVEVDACHRKLDYFIQKQWIKAVNPNEGSNTIAGVDFTESLNKLKNL